MRINLPITSREYPLPDGVAMVSRTDLKGCITYVNPTFVEVSGFTRPSSWARSTTSSAIPTCRPRSLPTCATVIRQARTLQAHEVGT